MSIPSKFYYEKNSRHATRTFGQDQPSLFRNQPRFPFEYYININLNNIGTAQTFIAEFFNSLEIEQIMPLVKTIDMPSFKIETTPLNQYNRKRLSQTKIEFEPVKAVFHDVADGKTLKFWDMYYRYYFSDGNEPGKNSEKVLPTFGGTEYNEGGAAAGGRGSQGVRLANGIASSTNTDGQKQQILNIVSDKLDNHNFGFNLPTVENVRNLIQTIDIYQVHGGRFNQVTLVNPRISAFTHDVLNYAASDKTLEITFMFEYEYAYYTIQNMQLTDATSIPPVGGQTNNNSSITPFKDGGFFELTNLSFKKWDPAFIESNNPSSQPDAVIIGTNTQTPLYDVANAGQSTSDFAATEPRRLDITTRTSSSSLDGLVDVTPTPENIPSTPYIQTRPFEFAATVEPIGLARGDTGADFTGDAGYTFYPDMNRASGT